MLIQQRRRDSEARRVRNQQSSISLVQAEIVKIGSNKDAVNTFDDQLPNSQKSDFTDFYYIDGYDSEIDIINLEVYEEYS